MSMVTDLFFDGGDDRPANGPPRGGRERLGTVYFALKPQPDVASSVAPVGNRLGDKHGLVGHVSPTVLHVTLAPIGVLPELSDERIDAACKVASGLVAEPFEILFDRVGTYQNRAEKPPFVAFAHDGVPRATLFRHALIKGLRRNGFNVARKLPKLHMTLFYDRCVVAEESIDPICWLVRDFVLIHSIYGEGRHELLGQWPLRGRGGPILS
jgi:2'-5' RNA ligase